MKDTMYQASLFISGILIVIGFNILYPRHNAHAGTLVTTQVPCSMCSESPESTEQEKDILLEEDRISYLVFNGLWGLTDFQWWMLLTLVIAVLAILLGVWFTGFERDCLAIFLGLGIGVLGWLFLEREGGLGPVAFGFVFSPMIMLFSARFSNYITGWWYGKRHHE